MMRLLRLVLSACAVLAVSMPGAAVRCRQTPESGYLQGPGSVSPNSIAQFSLFVTFSDCSTATYTDAPATFACDVGSFVGTTANYKSPPMTGRAKLSAELTMDGVTLDVDRVILVQ